MLKNCWGLLGRGQTGVAAGTPSPPAPPEPPRAPQGQQDIAQVPQPHADPAVLRPSNPPPLGRSSKEEADARFCVENIYFTTVVSDNLAIFILVYIQTYKTRITMLKHKIIPSALTACMYRSSVVSSVTIHRVQTATSTYIQFKVWSFSNITKYIYVYIIIAFQMHLYFNCGFFFLTFVSPPPRVAVQCKCKTRLPPGARSSQRLRTEANATKPRHELLSSGPRSHAK